ncbi:elongation of very long chain fatty acids protein baldspot isoform X2 [Oratosquilla oratoria]|uniref:elongation of very long chain fatty acids protein baldspot isoform X2 n=1 Tax=Oratosquilla oratoria TaxID=337810 RepID=UPI003F75D03A
MADATFTINITNFWANDRRGLYNITYPLAMPFEQHFNSHEWVMWFDKHWCWGFYMAAAYVALIYCLKTWMETRPRLELRTPLAVWNICLALFSLYGALRSLHELVYVYTNFGIYSTICLCGHSFLDNRVGGFWNWMFTLSKVPELGDTVFIVLRKQPLIFLHWYHHVTVLLYAWYSYSDYIATARWFVCMNYMVHSVMYSYYALKALRFKVPRGISMAITTAQLAQMVMGAAVNIWAYQVKQAGQECHVSYENIKISLLMYTSYFVLFARFFNRAYFMSKIQDPKAAKKGEALAYEHEKNNKGKID